jgi:hypothetical protein
MEVRKTIKDLPAIEDDPRFLQLIKDYKCILIILRTHFIDNCNSYRAYVGGFLAGLLSYEQYFTQLPVSIL